MRRPRRAGFEQFAADHGAELIRLAFAVSGDRERAQDAAQEALTRVYQRWSQLEHPLVYARRTVITATRDDWRRSMRQSRVRQRIAGLPVQAPSHPQASIAEHEALLQAMGELTHRQRAVVILRYRIGLSEAETARTLEISVGTVKSLASRGLARLRSQLADEQEQDIPHDMETAR